MGIQKKTGSREGKDGPVTNVSGGGDPAAKLEVLDRDALGTSRQGGVASVRNEVGVSIHKRQGGGENCGVSEGAQALGRA